MMFLDTSGLLCLLDRREPFHPQAVGLYQDASRKLTHNYILVEWIALAHARGFNRAVAVEFAMKLLDSRNIQMVWIDQPLHRDSLNLLKARPDKTYSLCDATSFVLMQRERISEALTTDRHFEQEGFRRLLI